MAGSVIQAIGRSNFEDGLKTGIQTGQKTGKSNLYGHVQYCMTAQLL